MDLPIDRSTAAKIARECRGLRHAHVLAAWVGDGKPVTAKGVVRRVDVPPAGQALGIAVPDRIRSAADVPDLHRPWAAALDLALLSVNNGKAVPGPAVPNWPPATDEETLEYWSRALVTVLAEAFDANVRAEAWELGRTALTVLSTEPALAGDELLETIQHTVIHTNDEAFALIVRGFGSRHPATIILSVLSTFGAVTEDEQHPTITPLGHWALTEITSHSTALSSGSPAESELDADTVCQLVIALEQVRLSCWRRVLVPPTATLGDLHEILQIALEWDDDHLHVFTIGQRQYGNPDFGADFSENNVTLNEAFSRRWTISYVYDLGDDWLHRITLEDTQQLDPQATYPACVGGRRNTPVEDWNGEGPESIPYDQARINTRLAALHHRERRLSSELNEVIDTILIDAYGETEETTAFECVLGEEIDFPVPATLLGQPVTVTGLEVSDTAPYLRARCERRKQHTSVSFAELVFRYGTIETWLQAAYLTYLGHPRPDAVPPRHWDGLGDWIS